VSGANAPERRGAGDTPIDPGWVRGLPKAEVHVHLEGSLPPELVAGAARQLGRDLPDLAFTDLAGFLAYLDVSCAVITTADQVAAAAGAVARRGADAGVRYVDLIWNPTHWPVWRDRLAEFVDALDAGFRDAAADGLPAVGVCVSLKRTQSASEALDLVERVNAMRHPRVVALSIDGNEATAGSTGPRFAAAFSRARAAGLHCCAHAGESSGPEGVLDAIEHLGAERIDHGVRAVEDPALVRRLATLGVPLDVCPTSNVRLGVAPSLAEHPIDALRRAGVRVSLNTDDPVLFGSTVDGEYRACVEAFGWTRADAGAVARTSIDSCFADAGLRQDLVRDLEAYLSSPVS
jgi:adenosine deaminase